MNPLLILTRIRHEPNSTLGTLEIGGPVFKHYATLEPLPPVIPPGLWDLQFEYSAKFKRHLWELKGIPGHTELKIHNGNTHYAADPKTRLTYEQTEGCILVGMRHGELFINARGHGKMPTINDDQPAVLGSRIALSSLHEALRRYEGQRLSIEVIDAVGD